MNSAALATLTPSERNVLRTLLRERDQKTVARILGLSPETVKTHLRNAREKCGAQDSFSLAKELARQEPPTPDRGITLHGGEAETARPAISAFVEHVPEHRVEVDGLAEERAVFRFVEAAPDHAPMCLPEGGSNDLTGGKRLLLAGGLVLVAMLAIILAFPLSESFQRLADALDASNRSTIQ